jgi:hypothetical protein
MIIDAVIEITNLILSIVAIIIAVPLIKKSKNVILVAYWRYLLTALILFAIFQIVSNLRTYGIIEIPYFTHIITFFILLFLLITLVKTEYVARE